MKCLCCNTELFDILETCEHTILDSGSVYNYEFGQMDYWFEAELHCHNCGHKFYHSDSSL